MEVIKSLLQSIYKYIQKLLQDLLDREVKAIFATAADLDSTGLTEGDNVKVLLDENHNNAITYYKYTNGNFEYLGALGSMYSKDEADSIFLVKATVSNNKLIL